MFPYEMNKNVVSTEILSKKKRKLETTVSQVGCEKYAYL